MKTSEVLKHAKKHLARTWPEIDWNGGAKERFICMAIHEAQPDSRQQHHHHHHYERCMQMVEGRLEGQTTFEAWLASKGCIPRHWSEVDLATKDRIQQHRCAWLEQMIAEFEAKGD